MLPTTRLLSAAKSAPKIARIGFIGLGQMGLPMCANLLSKTTSEFTIFDTSGKSMQSLTESFPQSKITCAKSPREVAKNSDVVVTMLPQTEHVQSVYFGEKGLVEEAHRDLLLIDSSTIAPNASQNIAQEMLKHQVIAVDAPVSGGVPGAQAGTLTFMVGAPSKDIFNQTVPLLEMMGKNVVHCGGAGTGQIAKICNNMLLASSMIAVSETMNLGIKLGMDSKMLASIINTSTGKCWSSEIYNPCPGVVESAPSSRGYTGGFGASLMAKDLRLAVEAANNSQTTVFLGALANQIYSTIGKSADKDKDFSVVFKWLNKP